MEDAIASVRNGLLHCEHCEEERMVWAMFAEGDGLEKIACVTKEPLENYE